MNQKAFVAEFVGTFALIFVGAGSIIADYVSGGKSGLTGIALAHGLTIAVMVSATAAISGGHLNPAVTLALLFIKKIDVPNAVGYVIAQCLGAIVAAYLLLICMPHDAVSAVSLGTPALGVNITSGMGLLMEVITTFFLMFVIYGTAVDKRAPKLAGLFIGLTVALDIFVAGPVTGAAMNPARYLGPAVISGNLNLIWLYWLGPVSGALLAAFCYNKILE